MVSAFAERTDAKLAMKGGSILEALYWMPNPRVPNRRVYVRAGSLPSSDRATAAKQLQEEALPRFIKWLTCLHTAPDNDPRLFSEPYFEAKFIDGRLKIVAEPAAEPAAAADAPQTARR